MRASTVTDAMFIPVDLQFQLTNSRTIAYNSLISWDISVQDCKTISNCKTQ